MAVPDPLLAAVLEPLLLKVAIRVPAVLELKTRTAGTITLMPAVLEDNRRVILKNRRH